MIAFLPREPGDRDAFSAHWARITNDVTVITRVIEVEGAFAGYAVSFVIEGERQVGYWIARELWGRGIASAALRPWSPRSRSDRSGAAPPPTTSGRSGCSSMRVSSSTAWNAATPRAAARRSTRRSSGSTSEGRRGLAQLRCQLRQKRVELPGRGTYDLPPCERPEEVPAGSHVDDRVPHDGAARVRSRLDRVLAPVPVVALHGDATGCRVGQVVRLTLRIEPAREQREDARGARRNPALELSLDGRSRRTLDDAASLMPARAPGRRSPASRPAPPGAR